MLNKKILEEIDKNHPKDSSDNFSRFTNKFIKKMTVCLENFSYNILIANLHEMQNFLIKEINNKYTKKTLIDNFSKILITMIPIVPHLASECLKLLQTTKVSWPKFDENLLLEEIIPYVIQVNGKKRGLIESKRDISQEELLKTVEKEKNISKYFDINKVKKYIFIKNKLLNIII